ncbi:CamS family sex pheromone protein [Bacillus sp. DNRA2]|uniref:CamS family sex pheromone protein n=1 Tax=Bacillus sp. DNRA2 TaxID=2723053 RepID=UPI00145E7B8E|nr:CamS family sex pheromone protein [Bacillus sp. DNRA2]NMD69639.1 CamS family sex pheromone protein [Bacillus sp. DNRA2]
MKRLVMIALSLLLLLTACAPNFKKEDEVVQNNKSDSKEKAIIPKYQISDQYYRTILPFKPGEARGLVVNNLNTRYDINEFETGLMRVALKNFSPDKYFFQEGQYLKKKTVGLWLNRQFTPEQLAAEGLKEDENIGLNPLDDGVGDLKTRNEKSPIYLAHILEHDYLTKDDNGNVHLDGVVIGLALNSVYYYTTVQYGDVFERKIPHDELERKGKEIAAEVAKRIRGVEGLGDVPVTIALFEQADKSSVVPGNFFAYANMSEGSNSLGGWEAVDEKYYLFPSESATKDHRADVTFFQNFKQDVEEYFPNFNGVIGKAFYIGSQLNEVSISIPIQFYGKAEGVGFTQYVTGLVMEHFPDYVTVQVSITSVNGPEALIIRKADQNEPIVHIYQ